MGAPINRRVEAIDDRPEGVVCTGKIWLDRDRFDGTEYYVENPDGSRTYFQRLSKCKPNGAKATHIEKWFRVLD